MRCFIASNHLIIVHSAPPYRHQRRNSELVSLWIGLYFDPGHGSWTWNVVITSSAITLIQESRLSHAGFLWNIHGPNGTFSPIIKTLMGSRCPKFSNRIQLVGRAPAACSFFLCFVETTSEWWHQPGLTVSDTFSFFDGTEWKSQTRRNKDNQAYHRWRNMKETRHWIKCVYLVNNCWFKTTTKSQPPDSESFD